MSYMHAATPYDTELTRLRLLEARYDDVTRRRIDALGPWGGAHCLEVGAGAGSVTRMLAELVEPDGHVVALDLDPRFLTDGLPANVTVRRHDIVLDELETHRYDLVHCRALLLHLEDPVAALRRMVAALRPGGWLLVEDADFSSFAAVPGHPAAAGFDRACAVLLENCLGGSIDLGLGRRLPDLLDEFDLDDRGGEALEFHRVGASREAEFFVTGLEAMRDGVIPAAGEVASTLGPMIEALRDPTFAFVDSRNVAAWGRRPLPPYFG